MTHRPTTVVASRHGALLALVPGASPALDVPALRAVLARHGLALADGRDLAAAPEFIAAEGLSPADAAALAEDLRGIGLTVRVVNADGLTTSRRVGGALAAQMMAAMFAFGAFMTGMAPIIDAVHDSAPLPGWSFVPLVAGLLVMLWTALTALTLQQAGGSTLRVAGVPARGSLADEVAALAAQLPDHLAADLIARARRLEAHARKDPESQAARELGLLLVELRGEADAQVTEDARALRDELSRARRALAEAQRG